MRLACLARQHRPCSPRHAGSRGLSKNRLGTKSAVRAAAVRHDAGALVGGRLVSSIAMVNLFAIVALGFLLGMRHATDPDHVIAITTIVSRERSLKQAGVIGAVWGFGHTITILAVGAAMILFRVMLP